MFKKPHHHLPGEHYHTNLILPDFRDQNAEVELVLRLEKLQRELSPDEIITMGSPWPRRRERQVAIMQKPNGSFFKARKWLREDRDVACCSVSDEHPRRHAESQNEYTNRRIKELASDGAAYRSALRSRKDEIRELQRVVGELKADCRRELDGGLDRERARDRDRSLERERAKERDQYLDDERPRDRWDDRERRGGGRRRPFEEDDFDRRFGP